LNETAAFLVTSCDPIAARQVKLRVDQIAQRWEALFNKVKQYLHAGEILRHRKEYRQGKEKLEKWIIRANELLASVPVGSLSSLQQYGDDLQHLYTTVDEMEQLLKQISRHFQALVSELNAEELKEIDGSLKRQKDTLLRIRALISSRFQQFHQLCTQRESLEVIIILINNCLEKIK